MTENNETERRKKPRSECAVAIIWDEWGKRFFLKLTDGTYSVETCRNQYTPYGSSVRREKNEEAEDAVRRRLGKELGSHVQGEVCEAMQYWKTFRLEWEPPLQGYYFCHVFVAILEKPYHLESLVEQARCEGKKQGSISIISRERVEEMLRWNRAGQKTNNKNFFIGSREEIILKFLETLDSLGTEEFMARMKKRVIF